MDVSDIDGAECSRKVAGERRVSGVIRSLVNARDMQLECARVHYETMKHCMYLFLCMALRQCYRKRRRDLGLGLYMDNLRGLLGIRRIDRVPNTRISELCGVTKKVD